MNIRINEEVREVPAGATVADIIQSLQLNPKFVAVEVNLELVPRDQHPQRVLADGDELEVVTLVGGG